MSGPVEALRRAMKKEARRALTETTRQKKQRLRAEFRAATCVTLRGRQIHRFPAPATPSSTCACGGRQHGAQLIV